MSKNIGAVGIDLGSTRSVIGVAKRGGVDILDNEANYTETPNYISYGQNERFLGNTGQSKAISNFKNTICNPNRLLGISQDYPNLNEETKWIPCSTSQNQQTKKIQFDVTYANEKIQLTPEQATATLLTKLKSIIQKHNIDDKDAVISVPTYYTEQERKALIDAAKIAELNVVRLFNESSAIATSYGFFRKEELDEEKPRYVVFVDFGHSKLSAFVAAFTKEKLKIVAQVNERNLGARDIDWKVFEFYANMFQQDSGLNPLNNKKAMLKLMEAIKKQRQVLSGIKESNISIECLMEDYDIEHTMKRDQFEKIGAPIFEKIQILLQKLMNQISENQDIQIHSVEALGGAFRIPAVQQIICDTFKVQKVSTTLNASESIAKGCALISAMNTQQFKVSEYLVEEQNSYPINVSWSFFKQEQIEEEQQEPKSSQIFSFGCQIPSVKSLTFSKSDGLKISCYYETAIPGFQQQLAYFEIPPTNPKEETFGVKARIKLNRNGIIEMEDVNLIEDYTVEEQLQQNKTSPTKSPQKKEEQKPQQVNLIKKNRISKIEFKQSNYYSYEKQQLDELFQIESAQKNYDLYIHDLQKIRNQFESYMFNCRTQIQRLKKDYVEQSKVQQMLNLLQEQENWLNEEDKQNNKSEYTTRQQEIQKAFNQLIQNKPQQEQKIQEKDKKSNKQEKQEQNVEVGQKKNAEKMELEQD